MAGVQTACRQPQGKQSLITSALLRSRITQESSLNAGFSLLLAELKRNCRLKVDTKCNLTMKAAVRGIP